MGTSLRDTATQIKNLARAFPAPREDNESYIDQCPESFDRDRLELFQRKLNSKEGGSLCKAAKTFQADTVRKWNPTIDEPTLSIFLRLVGLDESASKECGAITLDLLLRAGVIVESE